MGTGDIGGSGGIRGSLKAGGGVVGVTGGLTGVTGVTGVTGAGTGFTDLGQKDMEAEGSVSKESTA
jgi:hypothetical protein